MIKLYRLAGLLAALALLQLTACRTAQPWPGFNSPAYLPAHSGHNPPPVRRPLPARRLDSLSARPGAAPMGPFQP